MSSDTSTAAPLLRPRQPSNSAARPSALSLILSRAASTTQHRGASMLVRETAARELEERRADWGYSKPVVALDIMWNLAFVVVSVVLLICTANENPNVPIRVWVCGYALQCIVHVVLVWVEYSRRNSRRERNRGREQSSEDEYHSDNGEDEGRSGFLGMSNGSRSVKRCESINTMASFCHINPVLSLCTAVAERSSAVSITIVLTEEWLGLLAGAKLPPNVRFATIPNVVPSEKVRGDDLKAFVEAVLTKMEAPFEKLLDGLPPVDYIIGDAWLTWVHEVAGRRNIPSAHMWAMSASVYTIFYHFDLLVQNGHYPVDLAVNGDAIVDYIPGLSPIRVADLPLVIRDQESMPRLTHILPKESNAKTLIFASFYELEAQVFYALKQKLPLSIYNIAPATAYSKFKRFKTSSGAADDADYLRWLDLQPPSSVLYIALGSFLHITKAQMDEIAAGLQQSGVRFLWVARREATHLQEASGDKGLLVEWCDQLRVLGHPSVGGFMSHCGWNSTKEAVLAGVPMLTFPIIMDQLPDAKVIVEDWRTGWRVLEREYDETILKGRDEIAEIVRRFMDLESPERKELSRNARELQKICERDFEDGQSHQTNLDCFIGSILQV